MFSTSISQNLVNFIEDMQQDAPNPVDLELCLDFVESQGVDLTNDNVVNYIAKLIDINF